MTSPAQTERSVAFHSKGQPSFLLEGVLHEPTRQERSERAPVVILCHPQPASSDMHDPLTVALARSFEFKVPLVWLLAAPVTSGSTEPVATRVRLRASLWQDGLPTDSLPLEGWIDLPLLSEDELMLLA